MGHCDSRLSIQETTEKVGAPWSIVLRSLFSLLGLVFAVALALNQRAPVAQTQRTPQQQPSPTPGPKGEEIDPDDVIRINTTLVSSPVLVIGRNGKFVPNLKPEDFQVFENGVPQEIANFSPVEKPFTVALLIDTSRSTFLDLQDIKAAAISFVESMRPNDRALVVSFSSEIHVLAEATSDHEELKQAIGSCRPEANSRVYDSVSFVLSERFHQIPGRTAIVLFSDGVDNASTRSTYENSLQKIEQSQALIYPVQLSTYQRARNQTAPEGSGFNRNDYVRADAYLHQAASLSGTGVYPAQNISDLDSAISKIVDELHNEYTIGYYPKAPVKPDEQRRIEIRVRQPQLVVRARNSYARDTSGELSRISRSNRFTEPTTNVVGSVSERRNTKEEKPDTDARWFCKGPNAPTDLVVVKEGFVSHCPRSQSPNDETNAWFMKRPANNEIMCKGFLSWRGRELPGAPIPTGYIVTGEVESPLCSRSNLPEEKANAWLIRRPAGNDTVCKGFPLPRGFVMIREVVSSQCPKKPGDTNAWLIRPR